MRMDLCLSICPQTGFSTLLDHVNVSTPCSQFEIYVYFSLFTFSCSLAVSLFTITFTYATARIYLYLVCRRLLPCFVFSSNLLDSFLYCCVCVALLCSDIFSSLDLPFLFNILSRKNATTKNLKKNERKTRYTLLFLFDAEYCYLVKNDAGAQFIQTHT